MFNVVAVIILTLILTAAGSLLVFYYQYRVWRPGAWKHEVFQHLEALNRRANQLQDAARRDLDEDGRRLAERHFRQHLQTISIGELERFPGIGPATIDRVRAHIGSSMAGAEDFDFERIPGIGPVKSHDLRNAVRSLIREAKSRFEAGACPEAQEYRRRWAALAASEHDRVARAKRELQAVEEAIHATTELIEVARRINFAGYLFRRHEYAWVEEWCRDPLPAPVAAAADPNADVEPVRVEPQAPKVGKLVNVTASAKAAPPVAPASAAPRPAPVPADPFWGEPAPAKPVPFDASVRHPLMPLMRAICRFSFVVAKADGRIAQSEKKEIRRLLDTKFGHETVLARLIDPMMEDVEANLPSETEAIEQLRAFCTSAELAEMYAWAESVADAAGERNQRETELLTRIAAAFGMNRSPVAEMPLPPEEPEPAPVAPKRRLLPDWVAVDLAPAPPAPAEPTPAPGDPRQLLEIDPGAAVTADLVRRQFRKLSERLDPAKMAALGREFADMAEVKRRQLRIAAEALIAPLGESLDLPDPPPSADLRHNPDLDDVFGA